MLSFQIIFYQPLLESMVDITDEWITTRTGIKERRILKDKDKETSYLAIKAAQNLMIKDINPSEMIWLLLLLLHLI